MSRYDFYTILILFGVFAFIYIDKWYTKWLDQRNGW